MTVSGLASNRLAVLGFVERLVDGSSDALRDIDAAHGVSAALQPDRVAVLRAPRENGLVDVVAVAVHALVSRAREGEHRAAAHDEVAVRRAPVHRPVALGVAVGVEVAVLLVGRIAEPEFAAVHGERPADSALVAREADGARASLHEIVRGYERHPAHVVVLPAALGARGCGVEPRVHVQVGGIALEDDPPVARHVRRLPEPLVLADDRHRAAREGELVAALRGVEVEVAARRVVRGLRRGVDEREERPVRVVQREPGFVGEVEVVVRAAVGERARPAVVQVQEEPDASVRLADAGEGLLLAPVRVREPLVVVVAVDRHPRDDRVDVAVVVGGIDAGRAADVVAPVVDRQRPLDVVRPIVATAEVQGVCLRRGPAVGELEVADMDLVGDAALLDAVFVLVAGIRAVGRRSPESDMPADRQFRRGVRGVVEVPVRGIVSVLLQFVVAAGEKDGRRKPGVRGTGGPAQRGFQPGGRAPC